jgi:replicative DNA helicase
MSYALGVKVLKRLCQEQNALTWHKAKLSMVLFKPYEQPMYDWVAQHLKQFHVLPQLETLHAQFPDLAPVEIPEPSKYYLALLEQQYFYDVLNKANVDSQTLLKHAPNAHEQSVEILRKAIRTITEQKYRLRIVDVGKEGASLVMQAYYQSTLSESIAMFGWPYLDTQSGGIMPGDVISFVGRPAVGKTWLTLWTALHNWTERKMNVLYVSMEMMVLPIIQRITALYTHQNIKQLKMSGFSSSTLTKFGAGLKGLTFEKAKLYVVDGNLTSNVEDLFALAEMLECRIVMIDGAYLLRHNNSRLDRYTRAAENVELIKRACTDQEMISVCSWQFNREASKKQKKNKGEQGDLEDIGYSDAIGQISSIALSLFQEDSVETMKSRKVQVMKGRNGEVGQFSIAWDFILMTFHQTDPPLEPTKVVEGINLQWV